jgi:LacI family transcriptional regulator
MKKASVKEIARLANVSIGTVDRVLHERGRVSEKTRQKILKIIKQIDYKPNIYARNLKLSKIYHFGVLMPELHQDSQYWHLPYQGMEHAAHELKSLNVRIHYYFFNKFADSSFKKQCEQALAKDIDGLIIAPVLYEESKKMISCMPADLPYIFIDSTLPGAKPLSVIGQDSHQAGRLAASLMCTLLPEGGKIIVIRNLPHDYHIDQRIYGFKDLLQERDRQYHTVIIPLQHQDKAHLFNDAAQKIQADHHDLDGLFVPHANTYPFARHLVKQGGGKKIAVIGFDLIRENVELLKEGMIDFVISQRPRVQGYQSIYSLYRHFILKEKVAKKIVMPLEIFNKENITEDQPFFNALG